MSRLARAAGGAALTMAMLFATACGRDYPGGQAEMQELPSDAAGVVVVGPETLPFSSSADRTLVFVFNEQGTVVGRIEGDAVYTSKAVSWDRGFTTATAGSVLAVTGTGRTTVPIDENMVEGAAHDPQTGRTMFWFNTARPDGPGTGYRNNYVMTGPGRPPVTASVPGMMLTAAHCGDRAYGVVAGFDSLTSGEPTVSYQLYELPVSGGEPVLRGEWDYPVGFRSVSRTAACTADGSALYTLYGSVEARRSDTGQSGLTLVRIDTATGARTETAVNMAGHPARTRANTLTIVNDRLFWISFDGAVLSLPLAGASEVRQEWLLPADGDDQHVTVTGTTVAHIDSRETPTYTEYDLLTGKRTRGPIKLPWLAAIVGSRTESGKTYYAVSGVTSLLR